MLQPAWLLPAAPCDSGPDVKAAWFWTALLLPQVLKKIPMLQRAPFGRCARRDTSPDVKAAVLQAKAVQFWIQQKPRMGKGRETERKRRRDR